MPTAVVTGAAGFIGSHLTEELVRDGYRVVGLDSFHPWYSPAIKRANIDAVEEIADAGDGSFTLIKGSLLDEASLDRIPAAPRYVFHEAALAGVRHSIDTPPPYFRINVLGTANLLDRVKDAGTVVFASSSSIYGDVPEQDLPVGEDREPRPVAPYALSKLQGEQLVNQFADLYSLDASIVRYFSVYGPRQRPNQVFTKFIRHALEGETLPIYGDGSQSRDFTHVEDIVEGTLCAAKQGEGTYNLGTGRSVSVNEVVAAIDRVLDVPVEVVHREQVEGDVHHTRADITRAREELGYEPSVPFERGVRSCVEWVRTAHSRDLL